MSVKAPRGPQPRPASVSARDMDLSAARDMDLSAGGVLARAGGSGADCCWSSCRPTRYVMMTARLLPARATGVDACRDVYAHFNNDGYRHAVTNARRLRALITS